MMMLIKANINEANVGSKRCDCPLDKFNSQVGIALKQPRNHQNLLQKVEDGIKKLVSI
jgi:hypothetical protein